MCRSPGCYWLTHISVEAHVMIGCHQILPRFQSGVEHRQNPIMHHSHRWHMVWEIAVHTIIHPVETWSDLSLFGYQVLSAKINSGGREEMCVFFLPMYSYSSDFSNKQTYSIIVDLIILLTVYNDFGESLVIRVETSQRIFLSQKIHTSGMCWWTQSKSLFVKVPYSGTNFNHTFSQGVSVHAVWRIKIGLCCSGKRIHPR